MRTIKNNRFRYFPSTLKFNSLHFCSFFLWESPDCHQFGKGQISFIEFVDVFGLCTCFTRRFLFLEASDKNDVISHLDRFIVQVSHHLRALHSPFSIPVPHSKRAHSVPTDGETDATQQ